jgi:hypothetical protein
MFQLPFWYAVLVTALKEKFMSSRAAFPVRTIDPVTNLWRFSDDAEEPDTAIEVEPDFVEPPDSEDASDLEYEELPCTDDDSHWEAFIPDEDERDPEPDPGDFWMGQIADRGIRIAD